MSYLMRPVCTIYNYVYINVCMCVCRVRVYGSMYAQVSE